MGVPCRMPHDHDGNTQLLTEVLNDNGSGSGSCDTVVATHTAGLIDQKANRKVNRLRRKATVTEDPSIIAMEGMLIESLAGKQARLFTALPFILEYALDTSLQALG